MLDLLPDLFDHYLDKLSLLPSTFISYGGESLFYGEVVTVGCFEDNSKVKWVLSQAGKGKVLVVDGRGSSRALLGDMIAKSAVKNEWEGIIIHGNIRDVMCMRALKIGVQALGSNPIKTEKRNRGEINIELEIAGVNIQPKMWVYADAHGVAFSLKALDLSVLNE
ncbi:putative 4-hydroxy-4-methyl-2-oxoglutarate aldolase [Shewanella surugensis]|uniref:4-hydroxy-4-methyl-2-oxoglutarate aldolase n=1 Tax=Shewanella surugensis TaxID=212020 RepID=A0ABT0LBP7_9GAMM|nr:putative 4-hydroxy-4-methyl-2-oxoglutarate aldolase [Shewanella surugensis]MCL1125132.1 putative 4-hydroxy-4-methyl-2-oxoglutarate aldolase [Shewanella surugensis]